MANRIDEKSDILINIIGTSPMPNLLGSCLRVKKTGTVYLIHTKETENIACRLEKLVGKKEINSEMIILNVDEDPNVIYRNTRKYILDIINTEGVINKKLSVELNYTGGTKVMSSSAFDVFTDICKEKKIKGKLTYFDGEQSKIIIKDVLSGKWTELKYSEAKAKETFPITISDVIESHYNLEKVFKMCIIDKQVSTDFEKAIFKTITNNKDKRKSIVDFLNQLYKMSDINNKEKDDYKIRLKEMINNSEFELIRNFSIDDIYNSFKKTPNADVNGNKTYENVKKKLRGFWFEDIVSDIIYDLKANKRIDDAVANVERKREEAKKEDKEFEIDAILMKDYKLYCISITTADEPIVNATKLYEIKLRTELLGGSEANPIFITLYDNVKELYKKIEEVWDNTNISHFKILGWNDLDDMYEKLAKIIGGGE